MRRNRPLPVGERAYNLLYSPRTTPYSPSIWHYPRLLNATPAQRQNYEIMPMGIHWPDVDEDLSIHGILQGTKAPGAVPHPPLPDLSA